MAAAAIPFALRFFGMFKPDFPQETGGDGIKADVHSNYPDWDQYDGGEYVHKLTEENLTPFIKSQERVLVMFYAPWCMHCRSMKPDFARAAGLLANQSPKSIMACIDCVQYPRVLERFNVQGYPTIKYYVGGNFIGVYARARTAVEFITFMLRKPSRSSDM